MLFPNRKNRGVFFVFVLIPDQNCDYKTSFIRHILQCTRITIWGRGGRGDDAQTNKTKVGLESCNLGIVFPQPVYCFHFTSVVLYVFFVCYITFHNLIFSTIFS